MNWTWKKIGVIAGAGLVAVFLLGVMVDQLLLPWIVSMTDTISVPGVVGKSVSTASQELANAGLVVMEPREQYSASIAKGTVMSQLPYANATVKEGRRIYLTISKGIETIRVPSLYGLTVRDARLSLMRIGLQLGDVTYETSDAIAVDRIAAQGVPAGAEIPSDGIISVVVSRGSTGVRIPSLVGLSLEEAQGILLDAGLIVGTLSYKESSAFDSGVVLAHDPPADSSVAVGTPVQITVAR
ncbi:MAG: PASTA domain-containing protein [Ignavibacteria bacterium]|nr:PASTA domain-containing protein [Ignavibacteria bacterium]MBK7411509.1 PASTA domain-containing protein [Ignavibacteria bacterium]MBK7577742.1 PASTA domain-containing protein [Ignavibacteria bacterium]